MELNAFANLLNYQVQVEQVEIGNFADFIVDINRWTLLSLITRCGIWPLTKKFQVAIDLIEEIDHENRQIILGLKKEILRDSIQAQFISTSDSLANFFQWETYQYRHYFKIPANQNEVHVRAVNDFY